MEAQWLVTGCDDRDVVRPGGELEVVKIAAELFDKTGVRSVDEHLSTPRIDVELQPAHWSPFEWWPVRTGLGVAGVIAVARVKRHWKPGAPRPETKASRHESGNDGALCDEWPGQKRPCTDIARWWDECQR